MRARRNIGPGRDGLKGIVVSGSLVNSSAVMALLAIPGEVIWSSLIGGAVLAVGLVAIALRGDWSSARGVDKLILLGPICYAAPLAAFGTEHFTRAEAIASIVPAWLPWHQFWAYFVGACFIAAAFSLVTAIRTRLSAGLLALTFFLFVVLMDIPGWAEDPRDRFALTLAMLELRIWYPSVVIGVVAAALALAGLHLGTRLGARFGKRMEIVGGLVLIGIGVRVLLTHLWDARVFP